MQNISITKSSDYRQNKTTLIQFHNNYNKFKFSAGTKF